MIPKPVYVQCIQTYQKNGLAIGTQNGLVILIPNWHQYNQDNPNTTKYQLDYAIKQIHWSKQDNIFRIVTDKSSVVALHANKEKHLWGIQEILPGYFHVVMKASPQGSYIAALSCNLDFRIFQLEK